MDERILRESTGVKDCDRPGNEVVPRYPHRLPASAKKAAFSAASGGSPGMGACSCAEVAQ